MTPATFVRAASARATTDELCLDDGGLTPKLIELFNRTCCGVHLLAYERFSAATLGRQIASANGAKVALVQREM